MDRTEADDATLAGDDALLRLIVEGTASETGREFFRALVRNLSRALGTAGAWVTEYLRDGARLRSLAFWWKDAYIDPYEYDIAGTPCEPVIARKCLAHFPEDVFSLFPRDADLGRFGAVSYLGVPLLCTDGEVLGHLAVMDTKPLPPSPERIALFEVFAARAAAEHRRLEAEERLRSRERLLARVLESATDGILVLDDRFAVVRANPRAERLFGGSGSDLPGRGLGGLLDEASAKELHVRAGDLRGSEAAVRGHWFPRDLVAVRLDGSTFPAEATLSSFEDGDRTFFTAILRNADERLESERRIRMLSEEAEYFRDAARVAAGAGQILGRSAPMRELLDAIARVSAVDTTVLILGETGTGKELVARSIHQASRRGEAPLVRVNCAAIPGNLVESELFGHEKGAFTGATSRREGRFALADGGTIFLDEVGELPVDLQAKLLRVLQEGEFEPVGSSRTQRVDVRVIAATNRDLQRMVREGTYREDLYYRLAVFPVRVPPLRERGEDIVLLAESFAARLGARMGRRVDPLGLGEIARLSAYSWPGNVRELQNVIERAIILSPGSRLDLARALPEREPGAGRETEAPAPRASSTGAGGSREVPAPSSGDAAPVLSAAEMESRERENLLRALGAARWKVAGESGAAALLGIPPSTLASRMKALGIRRPAGAR